MASPCVGATNSVNLYQDGAGVLRGDVRPSTAFSNPLEIDSTGLVKRPGSVRFGWQADMTPNDVDLYNTVLAIAPASGLVEYGPRVTATYAVPYVIAAPWCGTATIGWEVQATYPGTANSSFSGITFQLQVSSSGTTWYPVKTAASQSASGQTFRWACTAEWPLAANVDTATHTLIFRMTARAGTSGAGENISCQLSEHRYVTIHY